MPPDIVQSKANLRFRLTDPNPTKDGKAVRFTVEIETPAGGVFLQVFGFRVTRGKVFPPARLDRRVWVDVAKLSTEGEWALEEMVREWEGAFPDVQFPRARTETRGE